MLSTSKYKPERVLLILILSAAGILRLWQMSWGLPDLYEEAIPYRAAYDFWNWDGKGITLNPDYFTYPAFTFYLNYIAQGLTFLIGYILRVYPDFATFQQINQDNYSTFVVIGRIITIAFDMGTVYVVYLLGKSLLDWRAGLVAAIIIALNPLHIKESNLVNVDTPLTFFAILTAYFIYRASVTPEKRWYIWAGISIGLAAATKYNGGLLALFLPLALMSQSSTLQDLKRNLKNINLYLALCVAFLTFLICNPYILLRFGEFRDAFSGAFSHMKYGHLGIDPTVSSWWYYLFDTLPQNLGWALFIIIIVSIIYSLIKKNKPLLMMLIFPVIYFPTFASWSMRAERYLLPIFPFLILPASVFLISLYARYFDHEENQPAKSNFVRWGIGVVVLVIMFYQPLQEVFAYNKRFTKPDTRLLAKMSVIDHLPEEGIIASGPYGINFPRAFHVLNIPFETVRTDVFAAFYRTEWYKDFDLVIVSSYDYDRYRQEPDRFKNYLAFYDSLKSQFKLIDTITPSEYSNGPKFWIYSPPVDSMDIPIDTSLFKAMDDVNDPELAGKFLDDLGMFISLKGKLQRSEEVLNYAAACDTTFADVRKHLGVVEILMGKYEQAVINFRMYVSRVNSDAVAYDALGDALFNLEKVDEAEKSYFAALTIDPKFENAYRGLVHVYTYKEDNVSMIKILQRYLNYLPPTSENAIMITKKIEELKQKVNH
ncbi:MAG: glycosyltransferase family 39 protein [Bacteroidota bacterium]